MAYIYKIVNDINQKIYIGKTEFSIEKRFKEHCSDSKKRQNEKRPLYSAMNKYGIKNFHIELIEETNNPEEREKYWIEQYGSFKNGYNATKGGDGTKYLDYELIIATYNKIQNQKEVAKLLNVNVDSINHILKERNIKVKSSQEIAIQNQGKKVAAINTKTNEIVKIFQSYGEAARWLQNINQTKSKDIYGISTHIGAVVKGKRKTAYGYKWESI